ncbi:MAG: LamG-like jellyroll fold domain-containing protein [Bacteroidota bacterium]
MKKLIVLMGLLSITVVAKAQTNYPSGVSGCIARWNFSSSGTITSLFDASGNNNSANTTSALIAAPGFRNWINKAAKFDGNSSYASLPSNTMLSPTQITMLALVKMNGFYSGSCQGNQIIIKGYTGYDNGVYGLSFSDNIYDGSCSVFDPLHEQLGPTLGPVGSLSGVYPPPGNYIDTTKWFFVAISYDGNIAKFYQVVMDTTIYSSTITPYFTTNSLNTPLGTNTMDLAIGRTFYGPDPYWFNGVMDEVVIFNRVLADSEVHSVYDYLWRVVNIDQPVTPTNICSGDTLHVHYAVKDTMNAGNIFTVQLSDGNGSFASPVVIGAVTSTLSGMINCPVPTSTPTGTGYRVRIVSSSPYFISKDNGVNISIANSPITPTVVVAANPSLSVTTGTLVTFTANTNMSNATFQWQVNNVNVGTNSNSYSYIPFDGDQVLCSVTVLSGCYTVYEDSNKVSMHVYSGINNINKGVDQISIYPTPSNGSITVSGLLSIMDKLVSLEVINTMGQVVYTEKIIVNNSVLDQRVSLNIPAGLYILRISSSQKVINTQFTIQK